MLWESGVLQRYAVAEVRQGQDLWVRMQIVVLVGCTSSAALTLTLEPQEWTQDAVHFGFAVLLAVVYIVMADWHESVVALVRLVGSRFGVLARRVAVFLPVVLLGVWLVPGQKVS